MLDQLCDLKRKVKVSDCCLYYSRWFQFFVVHSSFPHSFSHLILPMHGNLTLRRNRCCRNPTASSDRRWFSQTYPRYLLIMESWRRSQFAHYIPSILMMALLTSFSDRAAELLVNPESWVLVLFLRQLQENGPENCLQLTWGISGVDSGNHSGHQAAAHPEGLFQPLLGFDLPLQIG